MWEDIIDAVTDLFGLDDNEPETEDLEVPGVELDLDGNGTIDAIGYDLNGDGSLDSFSVDTDGDELIDTLMDITPLDSNGDGIMDTVVVNQQHDSDGDGIADVFTTDEYHDVNGDGIADVVNSTQTLDLDQDGQLDYVAEFTGIDSNQDGIIDQFQVGEDLNGDGYIDAISGASQMDIGIYDLHEVADPVDDVMDGSVPAYDNFDIADADDPDVIGDPASAMDDWHWQETNSSCAVASQEFVLEELTGYEFEESELRDLAEQNGWYDPNGGTPMEDVGNILEAYGLNVEKSVGNDLDDLESALANGGEVIVGVDSGEIWYGEDDDMFMPGTDADHAVQVIGIDHSDPENPMVILNDPGCANGCGAMVPADMFMDAWEDSGYFMVEAYN